MNLCGWLVMVSDAGLSARERNDVATRIHASVGAWAKPYLFRVAPCRLGEDDVDEALQHLLVRCTFGTSRFRGTSEGEAHSWCMRVLANKGRDICRSRRRMIPGLLGERDEDDRSPRVPEPTTDPDVSALEIRTLETILAAIAGELPRLHRKQDIEGILRSVRVHLEARMGATLEEQCEKYGAGEAMSTKLQNRIYQYRNRGRKAACEALKALVAQGRFVLEDVEDAHRLIGCDAVSEKTADQRPEKSS